jgi:hypothetical protein
METSSNQQKLNKAASTFGSLIRAIPLGTATLLFVSFLLALINFLDGWQVRRACEFINYRQIIIFASLLLIQQTLYSRISLLCLEIK